MNDAFQALTSLVKFPIKKGEGNYSAVVIGAGTAGLVTAAGTAGLGVRVALLERNRMGATGLKRARK